MRRLRAGALGRGTALAGDQGAVQVIVLDAGAE